MADVQQKRVAILATNYFEESELVKPLEALRADGVIVEVYSDEPGEIQAMKGDSDKSTAIPVDKTFDDLRVDEIDAVVIPGGTINADNIRINEQAQQFVRRMMDTKKPVAVICHGPWLLISAGVVEGRKLTSYHTLVDDIRNAGGNWVDEEVVVDDNLITSRSPDDIPVFIDEIKRALAA